MEEQICFVTGIYLEVNWESWLLITRRRNTVYHREEATQKESEMVIHRHIIPHAWSRYCLHCMQLFQS